MTIVGLKEPQTFWTSEGTKKHAIVWVEFFMGQMKKRGAISRLKIILATFRQIDDFDIPMEAGYHREVQQEFGNFGVLITRKAEALMLHCAKPPRRLRAYVALISYLKIQTTSKHCFPVVTYNWLYEILKDKYLSEHDWWAVLFMQRVVDPHDGRNYMMVRENLIDHPESFR